MQIAALNKLIDDWAATEEELDKAKREITTPLYKKIEDLEKQILTALENEDMPNYRTPQFLVTRVVKYTVPTLKTPDEKKAYFAWLLDRSPDTYWAQIGVMSQTLNAYVNEQQQIAKDNKDLNFKIPGIRPPEAKPHLQRRKAK